MLETIVKTATPILITALLSIVTIIISALGDAAVKFVKANVEAVKLKIGEDTYNQRLSFAYQAWRVVDEYFRITPTVTKTIEAAQERFADEIRKLAPDITDDEIEQLRQAVAGQINKGRKAITE